MSRLGSLSQSGKGAVKVRKSCSTNHVAATVLAEGSVTVGVTVVAVVLGEGVTDSGVEGSVVAVVSSKADDNTWAAKVVADSMGVLVLGEGVTARLGNDLEGRLVVLTGGGGDGTVAGVVVVAGGMACCIKRWV